MATAPHFSLTGISNNTALSSPIRPGSPGWPMGQALHLSAHGNPAAPRPRLGKPRKAYHQPCPEGQARGEAGGCSEQGPQAVVGGTGQKVLLPLQALTSPAAIPAQRTRWYPGPRTALPVVASTLLSDLDPAVAMGPGPKALLETQMPVEATAAPGPMGPLPLTLENRPDPQGGPLKATAGRAGPRGTSLLCSPGWRGCQSDARQTPKGVEGYCVSWQVHSLSRSCHSLFLLRAARCILKMSRPGCNVNNAEGRSSCWGGAGMAWEGSCLIPGGRWKAGKPVTLEDKRSLHGCPAPPWEKPIRQAG